MLILCGIATENQSICLVDLLSQIKFSIQTVIIHSDNLVKHSRHAFYACFFFNLHQKHKNLEAPSVYIRGVCLLILTLVFEQTSKITCFVSIPAIFLCFQTYNKQPRNETKKVTRYNCQQPFVPCSASSLLRCLK